MFNQRPDAGPQLFYIMLVYQSFGEFKKEDYKVYTAAEHLETYREEYPTRRRQLNAVKKDIENMRHAVDFIAEQLAPVNAHFARFMGNKYTSLDLYDMQKDLQNLEAAREEIENTPCPAKAAKEAAAAAEAAAQEPQKITFELPDGVTTRDVLNLLRIASKEAHAQRMAIKLLSVEEWEQNHQKADYLNHLFNAANNLGDQAHEIAWKEADAVEQYYNTENLFEH
jgi:hypothetical protein